MELKIKDRDYVADGAGGLVRVSGWDELLERVLFKLSVRRGSFALAPELGSKLHLLWREKGESRATAAKQYAAEALADEEGLSVTGVELAEKNGLLELRVLLRYENETGEAVVTIGGERRMEELNAIYERMRAIFAEEAGFVPNDGCDAMVRLYALASEVQSLLAQADWVLDQSFPQTAVGQYLDYHAETRALTRLPAAKATGVLRFSAPSAAVTDYEIDAGSVAMTSGGVRFETTKKATLAKGETYVDVPASAVEAGASGNAIAGAIHLMSVYPVGITQCVNPEAFSGGSDEESDEKLRERVLASYKRLPNGANAAFYEQEAMSFPNVAAAKAVGRARGIGTVDVYVSTHAGAPDEKLLGEIEAVLQKKREIAVDVEVKAPTEKTVNMSAELTAEQGWTMQEITDAATAALQAYFTGERLGEAVYTAKLASILYGVEGVKNCHLLTPDEDVSVSATELPVLGTVTITEIGAGEA